MHFFCDSEDELASWPGVRSPGKTMVPPLRSPGFPVETRGVDDLHAALSTESRTRGRR
jgi:hypothetical protein